MAEITAVETCREDLDSPYTLVTFRVTRGRESAQLSEWLRKGLAYAAADLELVERIDSHVRCHESDAADLLEANGGNVHDAMDAALAGRVAS